MIMTQPATFEQLWSAIADIGRDPTTGGYRRFAWTQADLEHAGVVQRRVREPRSGSDRRSDGKPVGLVGRS